MPRWSQSRGALAALVVLLVTACGPTSGGSAPAQPAASAPAASAPAAPVAQNSAPAPVAALPKVRAAWTSDTAAELPLQVAREAGLFEQYGLDVSADRLAGGARR